MIPAAGAGLALGALVTVGAWSVAGPLTGVLTGACVVFAAGLVGYGRRASIERADERARGGVR